METKEDKIGKAVCLKVNDIVKDINRQVASRGVRVANALRNAELEVLKGNRTGKVYKKPGTSGKTMTKATRKLRKEYGHKLRRGQLYRASKPGEAPAKRTGALRLHWIGDVKSSRNGKTVAYIESNCSYADILENGKGMEARPFVERIKKKAKPEIDRILEKDYS